jgi:hypothetical protein
MPTSQTAEDRLVPAPYTPDTALPAPTPAERAALAPAASGPVAPIPSAGLTTDEARPAGEGSIGFTEPSIPAEVSAAWELELLIAGAVTFALFQLPSSLDGALTWLEPRVSGISQFVAYAGFLYAKSILYVLIIAFLLNLCSRAYWVGLVGLHSVFPKGVRWDRYGRAAGPFAIAEYKRRLASLPAVISRVDNFASVIFSFAFLIVLTFLVSVTLVAIVGGLGWAVSTYLLGGRYSKQMFFGVLALLVVPLIVGGIVDKVWGPRLDPESRGGRALRQLMRYGAWVNGSALFGPIFMTLFTNLSKRVMLPVFYGAVLVSLMFGMADLLGKMNGFGGGGSRFVPEDMDVRGVENAYYESMRQSGDPTTVPMIQSDIVTGPYVRLFIPYVPDRHDPWMASRCDGARPLRSTRPHVRANVSPTPRDDSAATHTLGCLARLHAVAVDGTPRPELQFRFYAHAQTGREGIITYIPTDGLAAGQHTITVRQPPRKPTSRRRGPLAPYEITFWR